MTFEYRALRVDVLRLAAHELGLLLGCYHSDITRVEKPTNRYVSKKARKGKTEDRNRKVVQHRPSVKGVHNSFTLAFYAVAKWDPNTAQRALLHDMLCFRRKKPLDRKKEVPIIVNVAKRVMPRPEFDSWLLKFEAELENHLAKFRAPAQSEGQTHDSILSALPGR